MNFNFDDFCKDISDITVPQKLAKYNGSIPRDLKVGDVVDRLEQLDLIKRLIRTDWKDNGQDRDDLYLIRNDSQYEVFVGERGGKGWLQSFDGLKGACFYWLDLLFQNLRHSAPDSKIG